MPCSTFRFKIPDLTAVEPSDRNEILRVKDFQGHHYMTIEEIDGRLLVTIGLIKAIVAELVNPILTTRRKGFDFNPSLFSPVPYICVSLTVSSLQPDGYRHLGNHDDRSE